MLKAVIDNNIENFTSWVDPAIADLTQQCIDMKNEIKELCNRCSLAEYKIKLALQILDESDLGYHNIGEDESYTLYKRLLNALEKGEYNEDEGH